MTEPQWRAAGYLARPSIVQERCPGVGCCNDCAGKVFKSVWKPGTRMAIMWCGIAVFAAIVWWLLTIFLP